MSKKNRKFFYNIMFYGRYGLTGKGHVSKRGYICKGLIDEIENELSKDDVLMNIIYMGMADD